MRSRALSQRWESVAGEIRRRGMRWTPQRRLVLEALAGSRGHLTGAEIVERCRHRDASTVPSTVYRTLDVLEELGIVRHGHGADGREEYHVEPEREHGHLHCEGCGRRWDLEAKEVDPLVRTLRAGREFEVDLSHLTLVGRCGACSRSGGPRSTRGGAAA